MIKVTVVYPNSSGSRFDIAYYCKTHIPLVQRLLGPVLKGVAVEHGIAGGTPGSAAPYLAIGQLQFDSVEAFEASFGRSEEHTSELQSLTNLVCRLLLEKKTSLNSS